MKYDIAGLDLALKTLINEFYPYTDSFSDELYTLDDVVHQLIFEIIKEEYKQYAPKKMVMDFLGDYDVDGSNRKYTRALQYAQHYRDHDNDLIENELGMRIPELEAQDMSGAKVFKGHQLTAHEFLGLKLQAECRLLNKLHEGQIESSEGFYLGRSIPVNKKLSEIFIQLHISEKSGRGVPKIVEIYGREAFKFEENDIVVTIPFNRAGRVGNNVGDKVGNKQSTLNQTRQTILSEMRNNPNITKAELSRILGISTTAIDNNISFLKKNGHIERIGSNKAGYWKVH